MAEHPKESPSIFGLFLHSSSLPTSTAARMPIPNSSLKRLLDVLPPAALPGMQPAAQAWGVFQTHGSLLKVSHNMQKPLFGVYQQCSVCVFGMVGCLASHWRGATQPMGPMPETT